MKKFTFPSSQAHELSARLDTPNGPVRGYALFAHCFTCSKDILGAKHIAEELTKQGIAVLRFDFTGLGMSEGEFENTNFSSNVQDIIKAADHMRKELKAPSLLIGHSLGGAAVLAAAQDIPEAKAVVTIGAPADASHVAHHFEDAREKIMKDGEAEICLVGRPFKIKKQFIEDIEAQNQEDNIKNLKRALLVMHAPRDDTVGIENATKIFVTAKHPKSFVTLDNADHLLSNKEDAAYAARVIASWAEKYIPKEPENMMALPEGMAVSKATMKGKFQQHVQVGNHTMIADEPKNYGGMDSGPTPYDHLKVALATCTSMTLQMYAEKKKLPLEGVEVYVSHDKIHAKDCSDCESKGGLIDEFTREIVIHGDALTGDDRDRVIEIADKCPVHRTLENEIKIRTKSKKPSP